MKLIANLDEKDGVSYIVPFSSIVEMSDWVKTILTVGNVIVLVFAFCGNLAAIFLIWRSRLPKRSTKLFLLTLTISDMVLALWAIPVNLGAITSKYHSWILGEYVCETAAFFQTTAVMMNAFCLFAIALERYLTVIGSLEKPMGSQKREYLPYIGLLCVWLIPIGAAVPQIRMYRLLSFKTLDDIHNFNGSDGGISNETYYVCVQPDGHPIPRNTIFYCTVGAVFTALLIGFLFCYLSIIKFINTHGNNFSRSHTGLALSTATNTTSAHTIDPTPGRQRIEVPKNRHQRTIRLIMALILIFSICRLPVWILIVVTNVVEVEVTGVSLSLMHSLHLLSSLSTALSPLMYVIWNKSLRTDKRARRSTSIRFKNIVSTAWSTCCRRSSQRKVQLNSSRPSVFIINPKKLDHYNFPSQYNSNKHLIRAENSGVIWRASSGNY